MDKHELKLQFARIKRETTQLMNERIYWGYFTTFVISIMGYRVLRKRVEIMAVNGRRYTKKILHINPEIIAWRKK